MQGKCLGAVPGRPWMPAPVAVLVEVDGEPVFQAYIAYCAICRGPCRGAPPPKVAYARPGKKKTKVAHAVVTFHQLLNIFSRGRLGVITCKNPV